MLKYVIVSPIAGSSILVQMQMGKIALPAYLNIIARWREERLEEGPGDHPAQCNCGRN